MSFTQQTAQGRWHHNQHHQLPCYVECCDQAHISAEIVGDSRHGACPAGHATQEGCFYIERRYTRQPPSEQQPCGYEYHDHDCGR